MSDSFINNLLPSKITYEGSAPYTLFKRDGTNLDDHLRTAFNRQLNDKDEPLDSDDFSWTWSQEKYLSTQDTRTLIKVISWMEMKKWSEFVNFYEIIRSDDPCKFYAVVEISRDESAFDGDTNFLLMTNSIKDHVIHKIIEFFVSKGIQLILSKDVLLFTIDDPTKLSYHIVIDNYVFENHDVVRGIAHEISVSLPEEIKKYMNLDVYEHQHLLTVYSCKEESKKSPLTADDLRKKIKIKGAGFTKYKVPTKTHETTWTYKDQTVEYELPNFNKRLIEMTSQRSEAERERIMMNIILKHSLISCRVEFYDLKKLKLSDSVDLQEIMAIKPVLGGLDSYVDMVLGILVEAYPELTGVYTVKEVTRTLIVLDRNQPLHCPLCETFHTACGAYISVLNERGDIMFVCREGHYPRYLGPVHPLIDIIPYDEVLLRLTSKNIEDYETKIQDELLLESDEIFEITLDSEPDDLLNNLLDVYRLIPFTKPPDQNRFTYKQLYKIMRRITFDKINTDHKWLFVTGMVKSCRLRYAEYQPRRTEDEVLKQIWLEWSQSSRRYSLFPIEWLSQLWDYLDISRNGLLKFNSFDLLKLFKEINPVVYNLFMEGNKSLRTFNYAPRSYQLPIEPRLIVDRYTQDRIKPLDRSKTIELIKSKMDTQKTRSLLDYINNNDDLDQIVYITVRFTMSQDASQVLSNGTNREVFFYKELDEREINSINPRAIIVIQLESLHKLSRNGRLLIDMPGLLILDECTSCCTQISSPTMKGHEQSIKIFRLLIKTAAKIVAMDADVDDRIITTLLRKRKEKIHVQWNDQKYQGRSSFRLFDEDQLKQQLFERLQNGENVFIICSSRTKAYRLRDQLEGTYSVRCHTSVESADDRRDLFNVNELWVRYRVVIITSTVTVGVNFFQEHFDSMFIFGQNGFTPSKRDLKQMTGRVRKLKTGLIFFYLDVFYYNIPFEYNDVRCDIMREYAGRIAALKEEESVSGKSLVSGVLARYKSTPKYKLVGTKYVLEEEDDSWITRIHILNLLEKNISNMFFEEEFEFMFKEQGISVTHVPITSPETTIDLAFTRSFSKERKALYEETDVLSLPESAVIKTKINRNCATVDEKFKYTVYTVCKHLTEKPSYGLFCEFEDNYSLFMRIIADRDGEITNVLKYEDKVFVHRIMNTGIFHQWSVMRDFANLAEIPNTVDPFTFDTYRLQKVDSGGPNIGQLNHQWSKWIARAIDAFLLPNKHVSTVKGFISCLGKILKSWTELTISYCGRAKHREMGGTDVIQSGVYLAHRGEDDPNTRIISMLRSYKNILFVDDGHEVITELDIIPEEEPPDEEPDQDGVVLEIIEDEQPTWVSTMTTL